MTSTAPPSDDSIQRVLFLASKIHVYGLPPLRSTKGYQASTWTNPSPGDPNPAKEIFVARLRVIETATPTVSNSGEEGEDIRVAILLEDPTNGELFAESPYTSTAVVEAAVDSSRFFAVRVVGPPSPNGKERMTATLGIGFEDRSESMEFGIVLQGCAKVLRFAGGEARDKGSSSAGRDSFGATLKKGKDEVVKKDWSLREGESIKVNVGGRIGRRPDDPGGVGSGAGGIEGSGDEKSALFSIKPPPPPPPPPCTASASLGSMPLPAPPPSAPMSRTEKRRSRELASHSQAEQKKTEAAALGFDDGEFGEFQ